MKLRVLSAILLLLTLAMPASAASVHKLVIDGSIGPATADYVVEGLEAASEAEAGAVILQMDTPGGLDQSMRTIVQAILSSDVPVIGYVAPSGARAASAGTYILYASHVAMMAPGTNLGAATPVQMGGMPGQPGDTGTTDPGSTGDGNGQPDAGGDDTAAAGADEGGEPTASASERKLINDAVAYIRSLAELRGRNADWAERAVRESVSLSADAALAAEVIDGVAATPAELLAAVDGRRVALEQGERTLALEGAAIVDRPPDWRHELLAAITNPNVAYILLLIGIYGLIFELANPGSLVPGVIGGISLILALFALQALPINFAGLGLLALGVLFMLAEALVPSFGALGVGGVLAFGLGSLLLFDTEGPGFELSMMLVAGVTAASLLIFLGTASLAMRAFRRRGVAGAAHLRGQTAEVIATRPVLRVRVEGESWRARGAADLSRGEQVEVVGVDGLTLNVARGDNTEGGNR
ncbi:NfeD family protein [Spiribacter pallidus]|jgi:membrane-bound serine protease (ClpP class)|uniref:Nodulation protein NfeD n=1 Tax=Spiribacter pallidus TaxID=1987936 RepID=A0ABV3TD08_9GAMM